MSFISTERNESRRRIFRVRLFIGLLSILCLFLSCGGPFSNSDALSQTNRQSDHQMTADDKQLEGIEKLVSDEGFVIPCLENARKKNELRPLSKQTAKEEVFVIVREPVRCTDDDNGIFQKLLGGGTKYEYKVLSITSYQTRESVFEHTVKFNIVPTNAIVELTYLDTNNDGRFDTVFQSGQLKKPVVPSWLSKPNL